MNVRVRSANRAIARGILAGIAGGTFFALVEMGVVAAAGGSALFPFQVISSIVLGPAALTTAYPITTVILAGIAIHFCLSAIYGVVFTLVAASLPEPSSPDLAYLVVAVLFSMVVWAVNFLIVAPVLFPQVAVVGVFWFGFTFAHAFYGLGLGGWLAITYSSREKNGAPSGT